MTTSAYCCLLILLIHTVTSANGQETEKNVKGTVKYFSTMKGFGFISRDNAPKKEDDVFIHISDLERAGLSTLAEGQRVTFDLERGARPKAVNIKLDS